MRFRRTLLQTRPGFIAALVIATVAAIGYVFSVSDHIAGFSDDSATYLIMANNLSPYSEPSDTFARSFNYHYLPAGFPMVIGVLGIENSLRTVHMLVLAELVIALVIFAAYCRTQVDRRYYLAPLLIFACLPSTWVELLKLMSENQYLMLTVLALMMMNNALARRNNILLYFALGLLLGFTALTRSIGVAMILTGILFAYLSNDSTKDRIVKICAVTIGSILPLAIWRLIQPDIEHSYILDAIARLGSEGIFSQLAASLGANIKGIHAAWVANIILHPDSASILRVWLVNSCILFVIAGMAVRINKSDVHYTILYLAVLLIWPYPGEMTRFLYPLMPLLCMYLVVGIYTAVGLLDLRNLTWPIVTLAILILPAPSLASMADRYTRAAQITDIDIQHIPELYETEDPKRAVSTAVIWSKQLQIMRSMREISDHIEKALFIKPQVLTYIGEIYAERIPIYRPQLEQEYFDYIFNSQASHILLTTIPVSQGAYDMHAVFSRISDPVLDIGTTSAGQYKSILTLFIVRPRQ